MSKITEYDPSFSGDKYQSMITLFGSLPEYPDLAIDVYVEQEIAGQDMASIKIVNGMGTATINFLSASQLDRLSLFLAVAAGKLRYCSGEKKT